MGKRPLPLIQPVPLPQGTDAFENTRQALIKELNDSIPEAYYLPQDVVDNAPANVMDILRTCEILTLQEIKITEDYDATALAEAIAKKEFAAVDVVTAFCKRAALAQQLTCCLTQYFMNEAIARARELDEYLAKEGKTVGPLHGVPVSVKEHMMLKGHYSSYGFLSSRTKTPDEHDAPLIKTLRDAGAVFYVKTNQPQGIMHLESDSWYGRVLNPYNTSLSAGGSTGGEAALIALRGSVLGIGTDIGGSIRGPSSFCGIYGFKPTAYTLTMSDMLPSGFPAELNVLCSIGPMARSIRDIELFMDLQIAARHHLHDPRVIPLAWNGLTTVLPDRPIRIGVMLNDGVITPQPPVLAALEWARAKLSLNKTRFELKPYTPYDCARAMSLLGEAYWPDNGLVFQSALDATGEPMYPLTRAVLAPVLGRTTELSASEVSAMRVARDEFRCAFAQHFTAQDIDVVLAPCFVGPACRHDTALYWNYTALWNFVDYPGIVVPTPMRVGRDAAAGAAAGMRYADSYVPLSEKCRHVREMWGEEGQGFEGAPINLQIVGRRYADSELMGVVGEILRGLGIDR